MIDRSKISLPSLKLNPAVISDPEAFSHAVGLPYVSVSIRYDGKKGHKTAVLSLSEDDIVRILAIQKGSHCYVVSVEFNPGGLLHGHNGVPITTPAMLCASLSELMCLMQMILQRSSEAIQVIPGLAASGASWARIEIPINLIDCDRVLFSASRAIILPGVRREPLPRRMSRKHSGTHLGLNSYCKDLELAKKSKRFGAEVEVPEIYRLEFTVSGPKLKQYFRFPGDKLTRFGLTDLRDVHRKLAGETRGFVFAPSDGAKGSKIARTIEVMVRNGRGSAEDLINDHMYADDPCRKTRSTLSKEVRAALEATSAISLEEVFNDQAYFDQPAVRIPKLEAYARERWVRAGTRPRIAEVYGGGDLCPEEFVPHVYAEQLNNDDYYHRVPAVPKPIIGATGSTLVGVSSVPGDAHTFAA